MNVPQLGVIALLKSAITQKAETLPEQFDIEKAYPVLRRHGIVAMGYVGALCCGISKDLPAMQKLRTDYYAATVKSQGQMAAIKKITQAFDGNGVDYMLLKGCNLKGMYPSHELRGMSDADVLIRLEQYPKIRDILQTLGFAEKEETDHEIIWESKALYLELHKRLIPTGNQDYFRYYGDGWKVARREQGTAYAMSAEDQFVYLFTHFAKHYRNGGIGCRHVMDLWVYLRKFPNMDQAYIHAELQTLGLMEFYDNMLCVIGAWFDEGAWKEKTELISQVIFASGNWGNARTRLLSEVVRRRKKDKTVFGGKINWLFHKVFLPLEKMRFQYPVLKNWPVLLPVYWVVRAFHAVFLEKARTKNLLGGLLETSKKELDTHEQSLAYVGLRFEK